MAETFIKWQPLGLPCNRNRPQTFKICLQCGRQYGPVGHLKRKYCSNACKYLGMRVKQHKPRATPTRQARNAHNLLKYHVDAGNIVRPNSCSKCGKACKPEGAHRDYSKALDVVWLCVSCHRKWDWAEPKRGVEKPTEFLPLLGWQDALKEEAIVTE